MSSVEVRASVMMGEAFLGLGRLYQARDAFTAAGVEMPKDRLIASGEKALEQGQLDTAYYLFREAAIFELQGANS